MKFKMIAAIVAVVAVAGFSSVQAQDCGCGGYGAYSGVVEGGCGGYGSFGEVGYGPSNCYRGISSAGAASLWSGYCTEDCSYKGPTRNGLLSRCKLRHGGGGCGLGGGCGIGGGVGGGCFGYPGGGCGCGTPSCGGGCSTPSCASAVRGGHFGGGGCGLKQKLSAKRGCGLRGGCLSGGCGGGGKLLGRCKSRHQPSSCGCDAPVSECSSCLSGACDGCGDCGGYFDAAVGYDYGNAGMQSYVGGSLTSACGCGG